MILTNKGDAVAMGDINTCLENILADEDFELPKIPLSGKIGKLIKSDGIDKAVEMVVELQEQNADDFEYDEFGVNSLGYSYLDNEEIDIALKLFKLNIEIRPNSSNTYDSYGEALLANEDTTAAIENYIVSVKMNPNNLSGINVLESLGVDTNEVLPNIKLSAEQLDAFVGNYELSPDVILNIIREGDQLYIHPTGQSKSELFATTESKFYNKTVNAQITFNKDESGNVVSLILHQGGDREASRIN